MPSHLAGNCILDVGMALLIIFIFWKIKMHEFDIIKRYFKQKTLSRSDVKLGIGDDCALLSIPKHQLLAVSIDTLVEGLHFPINTPAYDIGFKSLAVNLSDLAAMGAEPAWITLALTMPKANENWLQAFSQGLFELAQEYNLQLIGGDTTRGPLTITIQIHGFLPEKQALRRNGAKVGDKIYVSGPLGDAGLGLQIALGKIKVKADDEAYLLQRLNRPNPRVKLGLFLRDFAHSAIDISDGLLADLEHILSESKVGATIYTTLIPLSNELKRNASAEEAIHLALTAGDDYELCFTVSSEKEEKLIAALKKENTICYCIGEITQENALVLQDYPHVLPVKLGFTQF